MWPEQVLYSLAQTRLCSPIQLHLHALHCLITKSQTQTYVEHTELNSCNKSNSKGPRPGAGKELFGASITYATGAVLPSLTTFT